MSAKDLVFATSLLSPFQLELVRELNRGSGLRVRAAFTMPYREARGHHWTTELSDELKDVVAVAPRGMGPADVERWLEAQLDRWRPDCVLSGALHGPIHRAAAGFAERRRVPLGFWLEPADPRRSGAHRALVKLMVAARLRKAAFVLAIGDRAESYYGAFCSRTALVPYGEDLSTCFAMTREPAVGRPLRLLYSGQLLPRQNIGLILESAATLARARGPVFTLCIAGKGPEQATIDRATEREPLLRRILEYDREYAQWTDRLRPFARSDVLVYPSAHSGWGLVIPEAMAAGLAVVTTRNVEAARFYIRHRVNGVFVQPTAAALVRELEMFLDHPGDAARMGDRAREAARDGDVVSVAERFAEAIRRST